jgi:hypothetical protein
MGKTPSSSALGDKFVAVYCDGLLVKSNLIVSRRYIFFDLDKPKFAKALVDRSLLYSL